MKWDKVRSLPPAMLTKLLLSHPEFKVQLSKPDQVVPKGCRLQIRNNLEHLLREKGIPQGARRKLSSVLAAAAA